MFDPLGYFYNPRSPIKRFRAVFWPSFAVNRTSWRLNYMTSESVQKIGRVRNQNLKFDF